jgi:RecB family exonuclease
VRAITSSAAFGFGATMHLALQKFHNLENLPKASSEMRRILSENWDKSAYASEDEEAAYFVKGCTALENYYEAVIGVAEETLGTEVFMTFIVNLKGVKIRLGCRVDRLALLPDKTLEVIDYKTNASGKVPTPEFLRNDLATFLYYVLTRLTYPQYPQIRIKFLNVLSMSSASVEYDMEQIEKNKRALWHCLKALPDEKFLPQTGDACAWCDFQDDCPATNRIVDFSLI